MHKFYSYLPLWNSSFDVVVGLDFSIQVKLFFSGYVFNRVGMADQNQEKNLGRSVHYGKYMLESQINLAGNFLELW